MGQSNTSRWTVLVVLNLLAICVLGFLQSTQAQPQGNLPFANAVEQRNEMIVQLREINAQLKEQNALLRSGKLQVVSAPKSR